MTPHRRAQAHAPEDLGRYFLERASRGDVEGVLALYEPNALLATVHAEEIRSTSALRRFYEDLLAGTAVFEGDIQPALVNGELALTSTRFTATRLAPDGLERRLPTATAEVARQQPDGTWLWVIDQPNIVP
jgi:ketosteroid isomerase-like protein